MIRKLMVYKVHTIVFWSCEISLNLDFSINLLIWGYNKTERNPTKITLYTL